jgi:hypothetical protein
MRIKGGDEMAGFAHAFQIPVSMLRSVCRALVPHRRSCASYDGYGRAC